MEFLNWKNILLEWVNRLDFLGRPYYSLNLAEVEPFFDEFKTNVTTVNIASKKLDSFLKHYYPELQLTYNKEGKICPDDYVYCYSLLMYFSCVTHPEERMQKICKAMQVETQMIVKTFLQNLLECNSFSQEAIKTVIETSAPAKMSDYVLVLSPIKGEVDLSPPTPRTKILNEWNSENRQLKAMVETERYEKGFLELQLKKKDEQINVLTQERRKFLTDIQDLKSKLSEKDMENIPPNENSQSESLKRRLRKEITDKDNEIKDLQNQVNDLTATKQHLAEKFSYVEAEFNKSVQCSGLLTAKLDEVTENCEKQLQHIKGLEITIKDYQKYFNESSSKGNSLDMSSENLDDSYAIAMAGMANMSNRSMSSPENLGKVVDIKLREQIMLYDNLMDKCNQMDEEKRALNDRINEHVETIRTLETRCREIEKENSENIQRHQDKMDELAALTQESENNLQSLQSLQNEFDALMAKVNESRQQIENLSSAKESLERQLHACETEVTALTDTNRTISAENSNHLLHIERLAASEQKLQLQVESDNNSMKQLQASIQRLESDLEKSRDGEANLHTEIDRLNQMQSDSLSQIRDLTIQIATANAKLIAAESLRADVASQNEEVHRQKDTKLRTMEQEKMELCEQIENLKVSLAEAEANKAKICTRNEEVVQAMEKEKAELKEGICDVSVKLANVQATLAELTTANAANIKQIADKDAQIDEFKEQIQSLENERKIVDSALSDLTASNQLVVSQSQQLQEKLTAAEATRVDVEAKLAAIGEERNTLCEQVERLKASLADAEAHKSAASTQNEQLLLVAEQEKAELRAEICNREASLVDVQAALTKLTTTTSDCVANLQAEIDRLNGLLSDSQSKFGDLTRQINSANAELLAAASQNEETRRQSESNIAAMEQEKIILSAQVQDLKIAVADVEANKLKVCAQNEDTVVALEKEKAELAAEISNLESALTDTKATLAELTKDNEQKIADKDAQIDRFKEQIRTLENERKVIDAALSDLTTSNQSVVSDHLALQDKFSLTEASRADLEEQLTSVKLERNNLREQVEQLRTCVAETQTEKAKMSTRNDELVVILEKETSDLKAQICNLATNLAAKQTALAELTTTNEQSIADKDIQIAKLKEQIQCLEDERNDLTASNRSAVSDSSSLREQITSLEATRNDLEVQLNQSEEEKEKLFLNLQEKMDEAEATELTLVTLRQQYQAETAKCKELIAVNKSKCDEYESRIVELTKTVTELMSANANLSQEIDGSRESAAQIQTMYTESVERMNAERLSLEGDLNETRTKLSECLETNEQLSDKLRHLEHTLKEASDEKSQLKERLNEMEIERENAKTENQTFLGEHKLMAEELESSQRARDVLTEKCVSLTDELKAIEAKYNELESQFVDQSLKADEVKLVEAEVHELKQKILEMAEAAERNQSDLKAKLKANQEELAELSKKAEENEIQRAAEIEQLKEAVEKLNAENQSLSATNQQLSQHHSKVESDAHQKSTDFKAEIEELAKSKESLTLRLNDLNNETESLRKDLEKARAENVSLTDENIDLATEIEKVRRAYSECDETNRSEINSLKLEIDRLVATNSENHQRIEELKQQSSETKSMDDLRTSDEYKKLEADLKITCADLQSKIEECRQAQEIHVQLVNDNRILSAKLTKHRELSAQQEEEWQKERLALAEGSENACKEIRFELEGKLIKMKERMKHIYTEETSRAKEKHDKQEKELMQYTALYQQASEKIEKYKAHVQSLSKQIYNLNDQNLEAKKETEFLKNKLRLAENNPRDSRLFAPPNFGSNFKMEDEEGELFNNTYLADLKSGVSRTSPTGRESIRHSELQHRNSIAARHLRSTYAAQYGDQNLREEDISMPYLNDSMFSSQLDVRRGTLYQRPGPPTPSKNGGRLSFGGSNVTASDLFPKEVLKEQNNNAKSKGTPGKLMSMFSSSKHKETDRRKSITRPIYATFTSTPRQKSNWTRGRKSFLAIKDTASKPIDDETASTSSNDSLTKTSCRRKSVTRRFSIISKRRQDSALTSMLYKNRREHREKNHSKRLKGFEESRELFLHLNDDDDNDPFQLIFHENFTKFRSNDFFPVEFPLELRPSEQFEILSKRTASEHPYSNEPTTVEAIEAADSSQSLSPSFCQSKTMPNIIIYGKIPRIRVNELPHRELVRAKHRTGSVWLKLMHLTKQIIFLFVLIVAYASYTMSNFLIRKD